jgi:hypothetical protein
MSCLISAAHPHIPVRSHPFIFPLYNPSSVDVVAFWEIPSQQRSGHLLIPGITFGAGHAALKEIIDDAEGIKAKRNMYAETQREKNEILDAVRRSEWNAEMNPIVVTLQHGHKVEHDFKQGCVKRHAILPFTDSGFYQSMSCTNTFHSPQLVVDASVTLCPQTGFQCWNTVNLIVSHPVVYTFFVVEIITVVIEAIFCLRNILADSRSEGHSNPRR